jgi:molybdate transport system substrate-binding protein
MATNLQGGNPGGYVWLNAFVAGVLEKPMESINARFQKAHGVSVAPNYGASGWFYELIKKDHPCDVFFPGDWYYAEKLQDEGRLFAATRFLKTSAVLVVSATGQQKVRSLKDLANEGTTLAIANPGAPIGVYSARALKRAGLWETVLSKGNLKARPSAVNGVATMVKTNKVDAGIVFKPVAIAFDLQAVQTLPHNLTGEIVFGACTLRGRNEEWSKRFMSFASEHIKEFTQCGWERVA